jgi:hypothetical protein
MDHYSIFWCHCVLLALFNVVNSAPSHGIVASDDLFPSLWLLSR